MLALFISFFAPTQNLLVASEKCKSDPYLGAKVMDMV